LMTGGSERTVAEAVRHIDRLCMGHRPRRGVPVFTAFPITQEDRLTVRIQHRVVFPGGEAVLSTVLRPGESGARLSNEEAESLIRDNVRPRLRRKTIISERHSVAFAIVGKAADTVIEFALLLRRRKRYRNTS